MEEENGRRRGRLGQVEVVGEGVEGGDERGRRIQVVERGVRGRGIGCEDNQERVWGMVGMGEQWSDGGQEGVGTTTRASGEASGSGGSNPLHHSAWTRGLMTKYMLVHDIVRSLCKAMMLLRVGSWIHRPWRVGGAA
jgi:hypothetical protein